MNNKPNFTRVSQELPQGWPARPSRKLRWLIALVLLMALAVAMFSLAHRR